MRHRMISILAFSLVMALATGVALLAQDTATSTGKVANVDASAGTITLTTAGGSTDTFSTDSQSMYMSNGRTITLQSVKIGDQVTVTYRNDSGRKTATHVDVVSGAGSTTTRNTTYGSDTGTTTNSPTHDNNAAGGDTYNGTSSSTTATTHDRDRSMNGTTDSHLPRTASPLPLIGFTAGLFGAAALVLAAFRRFAF